MFLLRKLEQLFRPKNSESEKDTSFKAAIFIGKKVDPIEEALKELRDDY